MAQHFTFPLAFPSAPGIRMVETRPSRVVGRARSPLSLASKKEVSQGELWRFNVTIPIQTRDNALDWEAWFLALNGKEGTFLFGDPSHTSPRGSWAGAPVVDGAAQSGRALAIRGFTPSASAVVRPGDYLQIGAGAAARLYRVPGVANIDADGSGLATIDIFPRLREAPADGAAIVTSSPQGVFELASNDTPLAINEALLAQQFTFSIVEAF